MSESVPGFRKVRPGLYERLDAPRHVEVGERLMARVRAASPVLAELLDEAHGSAQQEGEVGG